MKTFELTDNNKKGVHTTTEVAIYVQIVKSRKLDKEAMRREALIYLKGFAKRLHEETGVVYTGQEVEIIGAQFVKNLDKHKNISKITVRL